jgi:hypothetical protein
MDRVVAELTRLGGGQSQPPASLPGYAPAAPAPAVAAGAGPSTLSSMPPSSPAPPPGTPLHWTKPPAPSRGRSALPWALGAAALLGVVGLGAWLMTPRPTHDTPALVQQTAGAGGIAIPPGLPKEVQEQIRKAQEAGARARAQAERLAMGLPEEGRASLLTEAGVKETLERFQERIGGGPVQAMKLVLYVPYAILSAQVPGEPDHVDQYTYRSGRVGDPEPVRVASLAQDRPLADLLFPLAELQPAIVPKLAQEALDRAGVPDGRVSHVIVEWDRSFTKRKVIRVYVNGKRNSAMLIADIRGEILKFVKN